MLKNTIIACLAAIFSMNGINAMAVSHRHKLHHSSPGIHATDRQAKAPHSFVVAIDAGHGGKDVGAIGPNGTYEKQVVYAISRKLENLIRQDANMKPVLVRKGDAFIGLQRRAEIAHDAGADLFVSIHADAFHDEGANGSAVFTLLNRGRGHSGPSASTRKASNRAAAKILGEFRS
ncbi:MAG: N-acetylmuramoyl-L-alanine amidase family protein, partial [Candidatus Methylumidiphilus sp.]